MLSPLSGIRVLDFTRILAGPYCTMLLGDLGATIYKVEKPGTGDDTRLWKPPEVNGLSCYFLSINRNKQSLALDLKKKEGLEIAKKLVSKCDVLVENFLPGTMDRMDLGYEKIKTINPGLIYCSISGYGSSGPYVKRGGYDVVAAALGGFLHIIGPEDGEPCKAGVAVTDLATGLYAFGAIQTALLQRYKTNKGQKIDCDLLSTQLSLLINVGSNYLNCNQDGTRRGTAHESIVPYQAFKTKDGYFVVGAGNNSLFKELCHLIDRNDLNDNEKFATNALRVQNRKELIAELQSTFGKKTNGEWVSLFQKARLPYSPINNLKEVFNDPQVRHNDLVKTIKHHEAGNLNLVGPPVKFSESENAVRSPPPSLGQHTKEILQNVLGMSENDIQSLAKKEVVQI